MRRLSKLLMGSLGLLPVLVLMGIACGGGATAPAPTAAEPMGTVMVATATPDPANAFRIGVMESLTGPGETYGTVSNQAKQMAAEEINAAGGVNGRMIELIVEDSKCNAQDAITAYNKLTDVDGVKIILGTSCSGAMLGAAPLAEKEGVILFSGLATNPDIAEAGDYIFRTSMSDAQVGVDTGNLLWADGVRSLATITEATDYAEGVRRTSVAHFEKLGGKVVGEERYASDVTDFKTQLTKLLGAEPDALHIAAQSEFTGGTIVKQARELGYEGPIYSEVVVIGTTALEIAGEAATGMKAITADLDPPTTRPRKSFPISGPSTTTLRCLGTWGRLTMTSTSLPSASSRPATTRTRTASGTVCMTSPGAALLGTTTALTKRARSSVFPMRSSRFFRSPKGTTTTRVTRCWAALLRERRKPWEAPSE